MRLALALCFAGTLLAGCAAPSAPVTRSGAAMDTSVPASAVTSVGLDVPADDPTLPRVDSTGHTPDQAVLALIDARNRGDWAVMYSAYATPSVDYATAKREAEAAAETYRDFRVLEVRVVSRDTAVVRVSYEASTTPPSGPVYGVSVAEPGEWWPLWMVGGRWKVQWMPRQ